MSLAKKSFIGSLWVTGISNLSFAINFFGQMFLARLLLPEDFGVFAIAMSVNNILFMLGGFGLAMACISLQNEPDVFDTGMILSWLLALALIVLGTGICFGLSFFYKQEIIVFFIMLCIGGVLQYPTSIYMAWMEKDFLFRRVAIVSGIARSSAVAIGVIFAYIGFGTWSLMAREFLSILFVFWGMAYFSKHTFQFRFNRHTALKIFQYGYNMLFMRMSEIIFIEMPNLLVGNICGINFLGLFERSFYLSRLTNNIFLPFISKVGFSLYSKVKDSNQKTSEGIYWSSMSIIRIMLPLSMLVFLFPEMILKILFGDKWDQASPLLMGFALLVVAAPAFEILKHALLANGYIRDVTIARTIGIVIFVAGIGIADLKNNWNYIPWSMSAGSLISTLFLARKLHIIGIRVRWMRIAGIPIILSCCLSFLGIYLKYQSINPILNAGIILTIWAIVIIFLEKNELIAFYHRVKE